MSVSVGIASPEDATRWDAFVFSHPQGTFFHRFGWTSVIEKSFRQRCHFLIAKQGETVAGVYPLVHVQSPVFGNRLVSTGWCVGGGILAESDEAATALFAAAADLLASTNAGYIESRDPSRPQPGAQIQEGIYATFDRPMEAEEDARLKQIPRKQRAVVRKALKTGMTWRIDPDPETFYGLYSLTMRNHGTPIFGKRYFQNLLQEFGADCDILTVYDGDRPLSSVMNYYFRDRVMPFYTGAVPEARKLGAADLMYWHLMGHGIQRGCTVFDFGRSKLETGPYSFKKNWGFEPRPIVGEFLMKGDAPLPNVNPNNPKYKLMINVWKRLPVPVANIIGPWVGRQVG
ncbi:MAG: FemAB family XrtA/PEP-CTERM system-associated protein [Magnetospiraceae bacterium]